MKSMKRNVRTNGKRRLNFMAIFIIAIIAGLFMVYAKTSATNENKIISDSLVRYYSEDFFKMNESSSVGIVSKNMPLPTELEESLKNIGKQELSYRSEDIYQASVTLGINPIVGAAIIDSIGLSSDRIKNMSKSDILINIRKARLSSNIRVKDLGSNTINTINSINSEIDKIVDARILRLWHDGEGVGKGVTRLPTRDSKAKL